jgi:hypothetical protein
MRSASFLDINELRVNDSNPRVHSDALKAARDARVNLIWNL